MGTFVLVSTINIKGKNPRWSNGHSMVSQYPFLLTPTTAVFGWVPGTEPEAGASCDSDSLRESSLVESKESRIEAGPKLSEDRGLAGGQLQPGPILTPVHKLRCRIRHRFVPYLR